MLTNPNPTLESPLACDLTAIPNAERDTHLTSAAYIFGAAEAVRELSNGYAFRLPSTTEMLLNTAQFIARERLCCAFFGFALEIEAEAGPFWLLLTGREGVKEVIKAELLNYLSKTVAATIAS